MSLLKMPKDPSTVPDPTFVEPGEYQLRCLSAEVVPRAGDKPGQNIRMMFEVIGQPNVEAIYNYIPFPDSELQDERQMNRNLRSIRQVCEAFNVPCGSEIELSLFVGAEGWAQLSERDDPNFGRSNDVKSFTRAAATADSGTALS